MKKAMLSLLAATCAYAGNHEMSIGPVAQCARNHQRYYPRVFTQDTYLYGGGVSYEYLEPDNFYAGFMGTYLKGSSKINETRYTTLTTRSTSVDLKITQMNLEGKLGYNFQVVSDFSVIPYIGIAKRSVRAVSEGLKPELRQGYDCLYLTAGAVSTFKLSPTVEMGIAFKRHYSMRGESYSNSKDFYLSPVLYGHEISFPWKINLKEFSIKFEPYFRKEDSRSKELAIGAILQGTYSY